MYDPEDSAQRTVDLLAEAICPLCDAELKADLSVSGIQARCPTCHGSLWCQMRTLGGAVVLDMMPRQTFQCQFARHLSASCLHFSGRSCVIVNLSEVELADSTFLGGLVLLKKRTDVAGGRLILCAPRPMLRVMFVATKLAEFFVIVATELDALRICSNGQTAEETGLDLPPGVADPDVERW
jgi:anti-anti-sigma regulatory factor